MRSKKMALIGAGSVSFTQGLVVDLIEDSSRTHWTLGLVDTNESALAAVRCVCEKMIRAKHADIRLIASPDRCDILQGTDYVVSTIGVGGRDAWQMDVEIPRKYGIFQPVGDTALPGGISRAMRMIPAMLDIVRDAKRLCPDAWFFNYANPMTAVCRAIRKAEGYPVVGLCHGVRGSETYLARFAGLDRAKTSSIAIGLNHLTFFCELRQDGQDAWPLVDARLGATEPFREAVPARDIEHARAFSWEVYRSLGAFPAAGDAHVVEFFPERFPHGAFYGKTLGVDIHRFGEYIEEGDAKFREMEAIAGSEDELDESFFDRFSGEREQLLDIIRSIEQDDRKVYSVNIPNRGAVPNLPTDAVLEMPGLACASGILPIGYDRFPGILAAIVARQLSIVELTVDAALRGDRRLMVEAVLCGGYLADRRTAESLVDELLSAHRAGLPQFR